MQSVAIGGWHADDRADAEKPVTTMLVKQTRHEARPQNAVQLIAKISAASIINQPHCG